MNKNSILNLNPRPFEHRPGRFVQYVTRFIIVAVALGLAHFAAAAAPEKSDLKFGFIKLTDCVPIIIAKEQNYFEDEGLYVTVEAQSNWKILLDRVISGELDGAHMLAGQPIAATIGFGTKAHVITAFSMDLNGNGITLGNAIWEQMKEMNPSLKKDPIERPLKAELLKPVVQKMKNAGTPMKMGMVFPVSTHNYELRYWPPVGFRRAFTRPPIPRARRTPMC
jgi:nitrate/nitrite transport system substrate-binding protein